MKEDCSNKGNCRRYERLIQKHLDGDITRRERRLLEEHLAECPRCREELAGYDAVRDLFREMREDPSEAPEGLFESLAEELEGVKSARGIALLLASPFFARYRAPVLAMASLVLVSVLAFGVGAGVLGGADRFAGDESVMAGEHALIQTNGGDTIVVFGDDGNADRYAAALNELEKAYLEALHSDEESENEGYIYTRWSGGESASPIR